MRARILIAALLVTGIWAIARSRPAPTARPEAARQIKLVDEASPVAPVVSALEAGRPTELAPARRIAARVPGPREAAPVPVSQPAPSLIPEIHPSVSSTTEAMDHMAMASMPAPVAPAQGTGTLASNSSESHWPMGNDHGRDPAIIIRGGMGGARDDCDLHRRGGGIAINRSVGMLGGMELGRNPTPYPAGTRIR